MPAPSILSHTPRLPTRLPTESSVHRELETRRNIRKRAKHNRGTCDAMRLAYAHVYDADSAAKSWSYTLDRSGHRDE